MRFASILLAATLNGAVAHAQSIEPPATTPAATPISTPADAAAGASTDAPARARAGWRVEGGYSSQALFDPGVHMFADSSWLPGMQARVGRDLLPEARFRLAPEASLALFSNSRGLSAGASSSLFLSRVELGARAGYAVDPRAHLVAFVRGGATGLAARARIADPYHARNRDAFAAGGFVGAGITLDSGRLSGSQHLSFSLEAGHTIATPLRFGHWGELDVNAASMAATAALSF